MGERFLALGEVTIIDANIGGDLICSGGRLKNPGNDALTLDRTDIAGSVFLDNGFYAKGCVRMNNTVVGSSLEMRHARIFNRGDAAFVCDSAYIKGSLLLKPLSQICGDVHLTTMQVGSLSDDAGSRKSLDGKLILDGFTYGRLIAAPVDAVRRIAWIGQQRPAHLREDFKPQPWEHLMKVLREMGHPEDARKVAIAKHKQMRSAKRFVSGSKLWDLIYGALVGYGYRPWRLLWIAAIVWLGSAAAYSIAIRPHWLGSSSPILVPSRAEANLPCLVERLSMRSDVPCPQPMPDYRNFVALAYSAEVLLPVISLGSKAEWKPALSAPDGSALPWGWALFIVYWLEIAFGWLAGLLMVAAIGNLVKKE